MEVGIDKINAYCGQTSLDIRQLFTARGLDDSRFDNLMMKSKSLNVPCEDAVTNAVNAAKPILNGLSESDRNKIELVITSSESGMDFGKSLSTFIHPHLQLSKKCRLLEIKQACYGGTAALQLAAHWILTQASPGAKALVIATDTSRSAVKLTYAEPSQGIAAVAMLLSDNPQTFILDIGATGYYGYDVLDTCRPEPEIETGDPDLSLLSYLDCLEHCYTHYCECVENVDLVDTFSYLAFHTPFGGMVKGAHRTLMRKFKNLNTQQIDDDFKQRVLPSFKYCVQVGNVYSATLYLALCGLIDSIDLNTAQRIGMYSYGSGCSSEFYSGILLPSAKPLLKTLNMEHAINNRFRLNMDTYDKLLMLNQEWHFGVKNKTVNIDPFSEIYEQQFSGKGLLVLDKVVDYKRHYRWS